MSHSRTVRSDIFARHVAPIHTLPRKILSYIFELVTFALSPNESSFVRDSLQKLPFHPNSVTTPTIICAVNRHWRYVGLTTPKLWSSIFVSIDDMIDCDYSDGGHPGSRRILDFESLACFLSRSRNSPIDILIDGRDPEWDFPDFCDDGHLDEGSSAYDHPFRPEFMKQVLDILFHHVSRWRSLVILADTWAPMHAAIYRLSSSPSSQGSSYNAIGGASCLETLTLMHCNEYIAHSDFFFPRELKEPISTPFAALLGHPYDSFSAAPRSLPRLQSVSLFGVHVNWADFSSLVSGTRGGLSGGIQILELGYHCCEVRPSVLDFCNILEGCPKLRSLSLKLSGPQDVEEVSEERSVTLPLLERLHLEYDSVQDAVRTLSLIRCPNLKNFVVEDVAHVDRILDNGSQLLIYCATGSLSTAFTQSDDMIASRISPTSLGATAQKPPFPLLEDLTLHRTTACMMTYSTLFASLSNLRRLTLRQTATDSIASLLPRHPFCDSRDAPEGRMSAPCVRLESLEDTHSEEQAYRIPSYTLRERERVGVPRVPEVMLHLEGPSEPSARPLTAM
ncbi:hypothetical protein BS17DRAFT_706773 [Gyrodon lividus]|nr:hypothetical protein BS17DRAFT_706773 [Gyrodon lividus]